jgi:hypothetical protein
MQDAATILNIYQNRGQRGLPLEQVYRQLFNPELYLRAYGKIYRNAGATTKGSTAETVDGMSLEKVQQIIDLLRQEKYRWTPVRRVEIPKPKGGTRPLGIPSWSDKLLCENYWRRTTNLDSATIPTVSDRREDAIRPSRKFRKRGRERSGSSREIFPSASTVSTTS